MFVSVQYESPFSVKSFESRFFPGCVCAFDCYFEASSCDAGGPGFPTSCARSGAACGSKTIIKTKRNCANLRADSGMGRAILWRSGCILTLSRCAPGTQELARLPAVVFLTQPIDACRLAESEFFAAKCRKSL